MTGWRRPLKVKHLISKASLPIILPGQRVCSDVWAIRSVRVQLSLTLAQQNCLGIFEGKIAYTLAQRLLGMTVESGVKVRQDYFFIKLEPLTVIRCGCFKRHQCSDIVS